MEKAPRGFSLFIYVFYVTDVTVVTDVTDVTVVTDVTNRHRLHPSSSSQMSSRLRVMWNGSLTGSATTFS